jgi:membrane associated rhomboid family serine protease
MAFLQSVPPRQPFFRAPSVVLWLIGTLVALHLARTSMAANQQDAIIDHFGFTPWRYSQAFVQNYNQNFLNSPMADPGSVGERAIPFVSYLGLHASWTHLVINSLWLLAFGPIVARRYGNMLFLLFFLVCGVAAAITYLAFNWGGALPVVGASGAISGLMAAALRMLPGQTPWAVPGETPLAPLFSRQLLVFTAIWAAINLLTGITGLGMGGESGLVAWQAHLGGFAAGLLLSGPFDRLRPRAVGTPVDR